MRTAATSVWKGMFPEMRTTEPNSPMARANPSPTPARIAGSRFGRTISRKLVQLLAPSAVAACSMSRSSSSSTGCTARTTNGSVTQRKGKVDQRIDRIFAGEIIAHQHLGDDRPHNCVDPGNDERADDAETKRRHGLGRRYRTPKTIPATSHRAVDDGCQRDQDDDAQIGGDKPDREGRSHRPGSGSSRSRCWCDGCRTSGKGDRAHCCRNWATSPVSGSKNLLVTSAHPPWSAMVKSFGGVG